MSEQKKVLLDIPFGEWAPALELPADQLYRAKQVWEWVFQKRAKTFADMTNLPAALRESWEKRFALRALSMDGQETSALDGTTRLFFRAADGGRVSAVFLPSRSDEEGESRRYSLCISTQVGCAWGCVFCASGRVAYERNLTTAEIVEQVLWAEESTGKRVSSVLYMGMGEPLANYANVLSSLRLFRSPMAFNLGARHVTVSTCGLAPQIMKLSEEAPKINLAISLHAADDETRKKILPKSSHWSIKELLQAAWAFQKGTGDGRVTFEYILLKGVNDSERAAQRLSNLLRAKNAWVNLIVYNPVPGLPYEAPEEPAVEAFAKILKDRGLFVHVRKPQGRDIQAGCGQLGAPTAV
jgi:23S rRNA (adenine2503-C2)-methyltransferase